MCDADTSHQSSTFTARTSSLQDTRETVHPGVVPSVSHISCILQPSEKLGDLFPRALYQQDDDHSFTATPTALSALIHFGELRKCSWKEALRAPRHAWRPGYTDQTHAPPQPSQSTLFTVKSQYWSGSRKHTTWPGSGAAIFVNRQSLCPVILTAVYERI